MRMSICFGRKKADSYEPAFFKTLGAYRTLVGEISTFTLEIDRGLISGRKFYASATNT